ncbi:MAG: hypothetical protein Q9195_003795 [Heterodermia aff. obscurata]
MSRERTSSLSGGASFASPPSANPEPAYIAASAAAQIITTDYQNRTADWFEDRSQKGDSESAVVSPASLSLVNAFLDQLLFSFLASARSTSIAALRPAVSEVLKPRLAKDAISGADQELQEFLGGGDEEELSAFHNGLESRAPWDLQLAWKRTRLRCMVYTRLGDMEEEEEEAFVNSEPAEEEGLRRLSRDVGIISPAAAIFLTSILEFIGEQVLMVAGEAAYLRIESKRLNDRADDASISSEAIRVVVEDFDTEKLAFNTTFGRLWRSWKKRVRISSTLGARTVSRDLGGGKGTLSPTGSQQPDGNKGPHVANIVETPSNIDTAEAALTAEDHGLLETQAEPSMSTQRETSNRPRSMVLYPQLHSGLSSHSEARSMQRGRSSSLPALQPASYISPLSETFLAPGSVKTPSHSLHEGEDSLPEDRATNVASSSAIRGTNCDSTPRLSGVSKFDAQLERRPSGISKEEVDGQTIELVEDRDSQDSQSSNVDEKALPFEPSNSVVDGQTSEGATDAHPDNPSRSTQPKSHDLNENTMKYWRGQEKLPKENASVSFRQIYGKENQGFVARPMQGEGPRKASGDADDHEYGRMWEHQAPYFYYGPTASHADDSPGSGLQDGILPSGHNPQAAHNENGAPPLTPLRELMEAAHDTSDEASSLAPSHEAPKPEHVSHERDQNGDVARADSFAPRLASQAKLASKFSDLRSRLPAVNTGTERAAVQRVLPSPVSAREPLTPVPRTSTSSNRDLRQIQTSSSSASQVSQKLKGFVGRDSSDGRRPTTPRRSSEGSSSMISDKRSLRTPKADEAQRNFDQLIKSDETIQYTLTPQNMRELEAPDSPRWNTHKRTNTAEMADFFRNTGPEESQRPWTSHSKASLKGFNGLAANPISIAKSTEPARPSPPAPESTFTPAKTTLRPTTSHSHSNVAREARANSESTRDFADFLRSTGPSQTALADTQAVQQPKGPAVAAPKPLSALPAVSRPASTSGPKKITKQNPSSGGQRTEVPPSQSLTMPSEVAGPVSVSHRTSKLQARDPTVSRDTSSDLIDFIRQGPSDRSEGKLRLPRAGDPARPFSDTNGITRGVQGRPSEGDNPRLSVASTHVSSVPSKSIHSVNSRTALLETGSPTQDTRHKASESVDSRPGRRNEPPQPVRKQHRNKDPYAIDTDSEADDDSGPQPHKAEESLIHFLNSVAPPPSPPARKMLVDGSTSSKSPAPGALKNQYPSMRDRLTRNGVSGTKPKAAPKETPMGVPSITRGKTEIRQSASHAVESRVPASLQMSAAMSSNRGRSETTPPNSGNVIRSQAPQLPPLNPRETSPHLISQVGSKMDSYKITHPTYAAHVDRERNGASRRSPMQHHQARGNREPDHGLSDLADFLKNSEPPTAPTSVESPLVKEKEKESGFGRMFSRRKKSAQT